MAMATENGETQLADVGSNNEAHQPLQFKFPKREFGKAKVVG